MKLNKTILAHLFLILFASLTLTGCDSLRALIDRHFPPLTTTDQQYASIETNLRTIDALIPHVGVHVDRELLLRHLPDELKAAAMAVEDKKILVRQLNPKLSFDKQAIFIDADFEITIPEHSADLTGAFTGVASVSTELDNLYVRSALRSLKLTSVKFTKKPSLAKKVLAELLTLILRNYMDNVNGQLLRKTAVVSIAWGDTYSPKIKDMFKGSGTEVMTEPISVSRYIKRTAIRVAANGISVLAELTKEKPVSPDPTPVRTVSRTNSELTKLFRDYERQFEAKWLSVFESVDPAAGITANVSKSETANVLNETLANPVTLKQNITIPRLEFNEKLEIKRGHVDCEKVRTKFEYPDFNGDSCDWNCMRTATVGLCPVCREVRFEEPACAASRRACKVRVEGERIAWQTARETARIAHQGKNEVKVGACNAQRELMDFMALGRFKGHVSGDGKARINLRSVRFNNDLSEFTMTYSGDLEARLNSRLEMNPVDLGHVFFCVNNYSLNTSSDLNFEVQERTSKIAVTALRSDETLILKIRLDKIPYSASIEPSPLHALLVDPKFSLLCPISEILGPIAAGGAVATLLGMIKLAPEQELLLLGKAKGNYGLEEMEIPIRPISFSINGGRNTKALIFWQAKSIQFKTLK